MRAGKSAIPRPRRRLLRTLLKRPRKIRRFAPRVDVEDLPVGPEDNAEAAHWGELAFLHDEVLVQHRDGTVSRLVHVVTMPHRAENLAQWDDVRVPYNARNARVVLCEATVRTPDARTHKARRETHLLLHPTGTVNREFRLLAVRFSPLRPGVIVEYEMQQDFFAIDKIGPALWDEFYLRGPFPCRRHRITVAVAPPFSPTIRRHHGAGEPSVAMVGGYQVHRWDLTDVPGMEVDEWTPAPRDAVPWVDVSTLPVWDPAAESLGEELAPPSDVPAALRQKAGELVDPMASERERAAAIHRYVAREVRFGRHPAEEWEPGRRDPGHMLEDLRGDCKDKSSLMVSMLKEVNIPARIAVVVTADRGRTPFLPSTRFNHAIVSARVDGKDLWLDATADAYAFGELPSNVQGIQALLLDADAPRMVEVPRAQPDEHFVSRVCSGRLNDEGAGRFRVEVTARGDLAAALRQPLADRASDHRRRTVQQIAAQDRPHVEVTDVVLPSADELSGDFNCRYAITFRRWARRVGDILLLRIPWSSPMESVGPISAAERPHPLAAPGPNCNVEEFEIHIPPGFAGYGLPQEHSEECDWCRYSCSIRQEGDRLVCRRRVIHSGGIVPAERFADFKAFWESCAAFDESDVVLMSAPE